MTKILNRAEVIDKMAAIGRDSLTLEEREALARFAQGNAQQFADMINDHLSGPFSDQDVADVLQLMLKRARGDN